VSVDQEPRTVSGKADWRELLHSVAEFEQRNGGLLVPAGAVVATPTAIEPPPAPAEPAPVVVEAPVATEIVPVRVPASLPVPAETETETVAVVRRSRRGSETAEQMRQRLAAERGRVSVRREDALERAEERADHELALADVKGNAASRRRELRERTRDEKQGAELAELYRRASRDGTRARIRADIQRSAEMRALRVELVRRSAWVIGLPILIGFAAWSTPGVQAGAVQLLGADQHDPLWWAAWLVEPLLIGVAAWVITIKSLLKAAGGDIDKRATGAKWGALVVSVALNMSGGWNGGQGWVAAIGEALAHSIGAIGAAVTAWLIGVVIDYASNARPWDGAVRIAEMKLVPPAGPEGVRTVIRRGKLAAAEAEGAGLPDDVRKLLAATQEAIEDGVLAPDPSAYAIYKRLMGGKGDRARSTQVAQLIEGWRPELRAV
jgi:hypothetical protein